MRNTLIAGVIGLCLFSVAAQFPGTVQPMAESDSVAALLVDLGDQPVSHQPDMTIPGVSAERGADLVLRGITQNAKGNTTERQSKHFVCTDCHNVQREDPDLAHPDAQARLQYVSEKGLPYLPGSPLYGAVNRTHFYNDDYQQKYGDLVLKARTNLREAIQLCAVECSQGRGLEPWELESVLAYLWTIDLKLGDLNLSSAEMQQLEQARRVGSGPAAEAAITLLKSRYLDRSPATFVTPPENRKTGYPEVNPGDPANGKLIYESSCLHCHAPGRVAFYRLDNAQQTLQFLARHAPRYTRYSIYQVIRYGTSPIPGKGTYMPNYTAQKLTDQQVEDLRAYIDAKAASLR